MGEGEQPARQRKHNDEHHRPIDRPFRTESPSCQLFHREWQRLNRLGPRRFRQGQDLTSEHAVGYGVKDVLHQLGDHKLRPNADEQRGIGQRCREPVAAEIADGAD